jgi:hypothetical protein
MVETRIDSKRGCGWRQEGGLYLVSGGEAVACGKLPVPLTICPTCSGGIHFARSWTWVDGDALAATKICSGARHAECSGCLLASATESKQGTSIGRAGLLWIGEKFYKTPADWMREAENLGVSRRIPAVPREFVLGKTVVLVAHNRAIKARCEECKGRGFTLVQATENDLPVGPPQKNPCANEDCEDGFVFSAGIFSAFVPSAVEYVTKGSETTEELEAIVKRGITPIKVIRNEPAEVSAA